MLVHSYDLIRVTQMYLVEKQNFKISCCHQNVVRMIIDNNITTSFMKCDTNQKFNAKISVHIMLRVLLCQVFTPPRVRFVCL